MTSIEELLVDGITVRAVHPPSASRRPVLFVHGYFATATIFDEWLPFFAARGFPAYALNLRGRRGSRLDAALGKASIEDFVDDVATVARTLGTPTIVGHSMGGLVTQKSAERGDAHAVVLMCPAPPRGISVTSPKLIVQQLKYIWPIVASRPVRPGREDLRGLALNRVPPSAQDALLDEMVPDSGRAAREMSINGVPVDRERIRCPMLVLTCDEDRFIPARIVQRIANRYGAPLRTMTGHGHMLPCEPGWESAADIIASWLAETA
jgi:pimeloyl-ACP methyl ester carboxylesterase